jgi:uncharacterized protein involved in response to NO
LPDSTPPFLAAALILSLPSSSSCGFTFAAMAARWDSVRWRRWRLQASRSYQLMAIQMIHTKRVPLGEGGRMKGYPPTGCPVSGPCASPLAPARP